MNPSDERKLVAAGDRTSWSLKRIAYVLESMTKGAHKAEKPCARCGSFLQEPKGTCAVCEMVEGTPAQIISPEPPPSTLSTVAELVAKLRHVVRSDFAVPVKACVEVDEQHWPQLLDALRSTPEFKYTAGGGTDRPCEVEVAGVVFRADMR
jgi:hypothetical protein